MLKLFWYLYYSFWPLSFIAVIWETLIAITLLINTCPKSTKRLLNNFYKRFSSVFDDGFEQLSANRVRTSFCPFGLWKKVFTIRKHTFTKCVALVLRYNDLPVNIFIKKEKLHLLHPMMIGKEAATRGIV